MRFYVRLLLMSAWFLSVMTLSAWAAEEGTVRATSSWVAEGRYYEIKEDQALFVGAFAGVMFVETKTGAMDSAQTPVPGDGGGQPHGWAAKWGRPLHHHDTLRRQGLCDVALRRGTWYRLCRHVQPHGRDGTLHRDHRQQCL